LRGALFLLGNAPHSVLKTVQFQGETASGNSMFATTSRRSWPDWTVNYESTIGKVWRHAWNSRISAVHRRTPW